MDEQIQKFLEDIDASIDPAGELVYVPWSKRRIRIKLNDKDKEIFYQDTPTRTKEIIRYTDVKSKVEVMELDDVYGQKKDVMVMDEAFKDVQKEEILQHLEPHVKVKIYKTELGKAVFAIKDDKEYWDEDADRTVMPIKNKVEENMFEDDDSSWQEDMSEFNRVSSKFIGGRSRDVLDFRALRDKAKRLEEMETKDFVCRPTIENYHSNDHLLFKKLKRREKDEHPYLYYGIEIEVEIPHIVNRKEFAETVIKKSNGIVTGSRDGSLVHGVEFFTRPTSYKALMSESFKENLQNMFDIFQEYGANVTDQSTAGMHIHMSKQFFTKSKGTKKTDDEIIADFQWIFEYYQKEIAAIAGRKPNGYCATQKMELENKLYNVQDNVEIRIKKAPVKRQHHSSVATGTQFPTIEVRIFRKPKTVLEMLAMVELCRNLAHMSRIHDIKGMNLKQLLSIKESPNLDKYVKNIGLDLGRTKPIKDTMEVVYAHNE